MITLRAGKRRYALVIAVLFWLLAMVLPVFAEGDGSGGGQSVPLSLADSTPANGARNVPLDTKIKLIFNKNVINMAVKDNNLRCFSLFAGSAAVPIDIQMADDQISPEFKREVTLVPRTGLQPGTDYKVVISGALQAKSGAVLGKDVKITFSTAGAPTVTPVAPTDPTAEGNLNQPSGPGKANNISEPDASQAAADPAEKNTKPAEKSVSKVKPESSISSQPESVSPRPAPGSDEAKAGDETTWLWPVLIVVIIVLGAGYGYLKKRR